jgi:hypothetical protein
MEPYRLNPLTNASYETLEKVCEELNEPYTTNIVQLYRIMKKADDEDRDLHVVNAAYNAVYMCVCHNEFTLTQMRDFIYELTCRGFNKCLLTDEQKELFLAWTEKIEEMSGNATPFELYYCADPRIMYILGR